MLSPEAHQRAANDENLKWPLWPTMVEKIDFLPKVLLGSKNTKKKAYGSDTNEGKT